MRINQIKRELQKLQRTIDRQPRVWRFRGRRVVHADEWKWGDWTKLPDSYFGLMINENSAPADYYRDYLALMEELEDPFYASTRCGHCAISQAQRAKKEIDRQDRYWQEQGGETAKEEWYQEAGEPYATRFRKQDAMQQVEWRIYNELGAANDRTCEVVNYFHCPYGDEWRQLQENGYHAYHLWRHVSWYDHHWNQDPSQTPPASEMKWFHFNEPPIIDITDFDDITRAIEDGRLARIQGEHAAYMNETGREIWAL
jgi:hypothetical protein